MKTGIVGQNSGSGYNLAGLINRTLERLKMSFSIYCQCGPGKKIILSRRRVYCGNCDKKINFREHQF